MPIIMRKEDDLSITIKEIGDKEIITRRTDKKTNYEHIKHESLFKYCNRKLGYARLLELRDFEYVNEPI